MKSAKSGIITPREYQIRGWRDNRLRATSASCATTSGSGRRSLVWHEDALSLLVTLPPEGYVEGRRKIKRGLVSC